MTTEAIYEAIKAKLEDAVQDIFIDMQNKLGITDGQTDLELEIMLGQDTRLLSKTIQLTLEYQHENSERTEIESGYVPEMDRTFIMEQYLDDIISLNDDVESMDRRDKEIAELTEKLQNRNEAIYKLRKQIDGLKKAVDILINTKSEDKTPEGIRLSVSDFSDVYEAMFCNGDYMTEDGWNNDEGLDLKEEHLYGHDVHLAWHGLWCNLQDGAIVYNYVINNLPELAEEIDD